MKYHSAVFITCTCVFLKKNTLFNDLIGILLVLHWFQKYLFCTLRLAQQLWCLCSHLAVKQYLTLKWTVISK